MFLNYYSYNINHLMKKFIIILFISFFSCLSDEETTQDNYIANLYGTYFLESYTDTAGNSYSSEVIEEECSNDMLIITQESIQYQYDVIFNSMCDFNLASERNFNYQIVGDASLISGIVREEIGSSTVNEGLDSIMVINGSMKIMYQIILNLKTMNYFMLKNFKTLTV